MKTRTALVTAFAILVTSAATAQAQEPRQSQVSLDGLDLNTDKGMDALQLRFDRAIARVCRATDARSSKQVRAIRQCRRDLHAETQVTIAGMRGKGRSLAHTSVAVISK